MTDLEQGMDMQMYMGIYTYATSSPAFNGRFPDSSTRALAHAGLIAYNLSQGCSQLLHFPESRRPQRSYYDN